MFNLHISSKNDQNIITKYIKRKNINYEKVTNIDHRMYIFTITMINGKIDKNANDNILTKCVLFICSSNLVTVAKFCTKNRLTVKFGDIPNAG